MQKHRVATTDIFVSPIGLGTVKLGRNVGVKYPNIFSLPDDQEIKNLLAIAKSNGINFLDTAPAYGTSESRLGFLLKSDRKHWVIMTKAGEFFENNNSTFDFSKKGIIESVHQSLLRLQTDYLDIVLIHSNGDDVKIIEGGALETLNELKNAGKIRAYGMSTKTIEGAQLAIESSDAAMITLNPICTNDRSVLQLAKQKNKAIFIKKALMSGHLNSLQSLKPIDETMQFIWQHTGVTSVIVGTINPTHLIENIESTKKSLKNVTESVTF